LSFHISLSDGAGQLEQSVRERRFAVVNVSDDREISNQFDIHTVRQTEIVTKWRYLRIFGLTAGTGVSNKFFAQSPKYLLQSRYTLRFL